MKNKITPFAINGKNLYDIFNQDLLGLVERQKEVKQLMYAFLIKEHLLLTGPAGTGKSLFAQNAFEAIDGAKTFSIHLTKQTTEEYVFGPLNIVELKKGNIIHNTTNSLLDADFAFIDEFFDASDVLLRSLLGILNERLWMKGSQQIKAKLHTAILTSNYKRENEITQAIMDRIVFKAEIQPIKNKGSRINMYKNFINPKKVISKIMPIKKLIEMSEIIIHPNTISFDKDILDAYDLVVEAYQKELKNKYISDRTKNKALKVMKASAIINNRDKVDFDDISELKYIFCTINNRIEEEYFDAAFEKHIGNIAETREITKELDNIDKSFKKMDKDFTNMKDLKFINTMRDLTAYLKALKELHYPNKNLEKKADLLSNGISDIINNNRDLLFKRTS